MEQNKKAFPPQGENRADEAAGSAEMGLKQSLTYLFQSIRGKYSLETYLESLGEFTDAEIRERTESGLIYRGGEAAFLAEPADADVRITIRLEFQDAAGEWKLRKAERFVPKAKFTTETVQRLEEAGELNFDIQAPGRDG